MTTRDQTDRTNGRAAADRGRWKRWLIGGLAMLLWSSFALAQTTPPSDGGSGAVSSARSWIFEAVIVVAMFGLAIYVVCRSSRRN